MEWHEPFLNFLFFLNSSVNYVRLIMSSHRLNLLLLFPVLVRPYQYPSRPSWRCLKWCFPMHWRPPPSGSSTPRWRCASCQSNRSCSLLTGSLDTRALPLICVQTQPLRTGYVWTPLLLFAVTQHSFTMPLCRHATTLLAVNRVVTDKKTFRCHVRVPAFTPAT